MKLKQDLSAHVKYRNITGCVLFLQVLYLDSLELEGHMLVHKSFPRVRDFVYERLRSMISADNNFSNHVSGSESKPPMPLRAPTKCIYSWALQHRNCGLESKG